MARAKLHSLKLTGFKSFPDEVSLDFAGKVSAIIGPNGCGKSNLVDAMLWVLGEQSPSLLRLKAMGDVVFSGAAGRAAGGAAEVTLDLHCDDGRWEKTGGHLEIRRRVFRSGPSEYRLNGRVARLKDVMDELMAIGLGTRDYSIIEQGRVGQVLSARPTDRRVLLEEAAGITHYKARRREAELKLERTRQNLLRLDDVITEVDRSLRQLRRQAKQADRHQKLEDQLKDRLLRLFTLQAHVLDGTRREIARQRATIQNEVAAAAAALGSAEADLSDARNEQDGRRQELEEKRAEVAELAGSRERLEAFLERSADLLDSLRASLDRARREHAALESSRGTAEANASEAKARHLGLTEALQSVQSKVDEAAANEDSARTRLAEVEAEAGQRRQDLLRTISTLTDIRNRLGALEREQDRLGYGIGQMEQELVRLEDRRAEITLRYQTASDESRAATAAAEELATQRQAFAGTRSGVLSEVTEAKQQAEALGHEAWELRHRLVGVNRDLARHAAALEQVKTFLPEEAVAGQVGDFLHPDPEMARHLDRVWGEELELPVVLQESLEPEQRRAAAKLEGRIRLAVAAAATPPTPPLELPAATPLFEAAGIAEEHRPWLARVLRPAYLCSDAGHARSLAEEHPEALVLDPDGILWRGLIMEPATPGAEIRGALALRTEKERLEGELEAILGRTETTASEQRELGARLEDLDRQLADVERRIVGAEQERARSGAVELSLSEELGRLEREGDSLRSEVQRNHQLAGEHDARRLRLEAEAGNHEARNLKLEHAVEEAANSLETFRDEAAEALRRLDRWRAEAQLAGEREVAARSEAERLEAERLEIGSKLERLQAEASELAGELERTENEVVRSRTRLAEEQGLLGSARDRERLLAELVAGVADKAARFETEVRARRQSHEQVRDTLHQVEVDRSRADAQWDGLRNTCFAELAVNPEQLLEHEVVEGDEDGALRAEIDGLRARLEKMGPVNLLALKEVDELGERSSFLKEQRKDLVEALKSIDATIQEIDTTCTDRFVETFERVNLVFAETFAHLFGGGAARLDLVDEDDPLDSGIDITAQPPGKKTQSVQLLSGGEKALTALSLLIALFRIKPSPFCILDEVDAPLDDANVERLADLVQAMTEHTQFILVTHNRRTMARADALYGVTMEEAGVSKVVSVRLED